MRKGCLQVLVWAGVAFGQAAFTKSIVYCRPGTHHRLRRQFHETNFENLTRCAGRKPPREAFLIQLREAREEWRRRLGIRKAPGVPA
jgi:hypothetical protein